MLAFCSLKTVLPQYPPEDDMLALVRGRLVLSQVQEWARHNRISDAVFIDFGAGSGWFTRLLLRAGVGHVFLIEQNGKRRCGLESSFAPQVADGRVTIAGDVAGLAAGKADAIVAMEVIEHIADDTAAVRNLARVLRPGGRLFMTVPHSLHAHNQGYRLSAEGGERHVRNGYSVDGLARLAAPHALRVLATGQFVNSWQLRLYCLQRDLTEERGKRFFSCFWRWKKAVVSLFDYLGRMFAGSGDQAVGHSLFMVLEKLPD